jgi:uncharacterized protein YbcI
VSDTETDRRPTDSLPAAISRQVVRLFAEYTGRGPTKARTTIRDDVIVCLTQDTLTKAERRLVQEGELELVVTLRLSFMSDHDGHNDYAAEVFVLDGPPTIPAAPGSQDGPPLTT